MTYRVLARKWRPSTFSQLVGQSHVLKALQNALEKGRLHHAYLLTGTRGVGKTTIARILARCFNCEVGTSAEPCGVCGACQEIAEGRSLDLIEVDAASRTKVEDTRELLENSQFAPSQGRYKIYLIDEVHMLSNHSFNALLKTLEEPPEHVIFIFATTHPQKIPVTVLSRCLQFHLKNLLPAQISAHLEHILKSEGIEFDQQALELIAHAAQGSMRDALSICEQAIAFGDDEVRQDQVREMLGIIDADMTAGLLESIARSQHGNALKMVNDYASHTVDFKVLIDSMLTMVHRIGLEQLQKGLGSENELQSEKIVELAATLDPALVQIYYQGLLLGKRDLGLAPDPITGMEMLVMRLLSFRPVHDAALLSLSSTGDSGQSEAPASAKKPEIIEDKTLLPSVDAEPATSPEPVAAEEQVQADYSPASFSNIDWCKAFSRIPLTGLVRAVAENCQWRSVLPEADTSFIIHFGLLSEDASLYKAEHATKLAQGLSIFFAQPVKAVVAIEEDREVFAHLDAGLTPARYRQEQELERRKTAISNMQDDSNVKKILSTFDASLDEENINVLDS